MQKCVFDYAADDTEMLRAIFLVFTHFSLSSVLLFMEILYISVKALFVILPNISLHVLQVRVRWRMQRGGDAVKPKHNLS